MTQQNLFENVTAITPIRWAGRKTKLLKVLIGAYEQLNFKPEIYYEPFFGSGALFFALKSKHLVNKASISDFLSELEIFYKVVKNPSSLNSFLQNVQSLFCSYNKKRTYGTKSNYYNEIRSEYNLLLNKSKHLLPDEKIDLSSYFYFLNKTGFNGLYRKNSEGSYNVPHGRRASSISQNVDLSFKDVQNFENVSLLLKNTKIYSGAYQKTFQIATKKDFIYIDPPYVNNFVDYSEKGFNDSDHIELSTNLEKLRLKGVKFLFSNSNTKKTLEIFKNPNLFAYEVGVTRTFDRNTKNKDGKTSEILISSFSLNNIGKSLW